MALSPTPPFEAALNLDAASVLLEKSKRNYARLVRQPLQRSTGPDQASPTRNAPGPGEPTRNDYKNSSGGVDAAGQEPGRSGHGAALSVAPAKENLAPAPPLQPPKDDAGGDGAGSTRPRSTVASLASTSPSRIVASTKPLPYSTTTGPQHGAARPSLRGEHDSLPVQLPDPSHLFQYEMQLIQRQDQVRTLQEELIWKGEERRRNRLLEMVEGQFKGLVDLTKRIEVITSESGVAAYGAVRDAEDVPRPAREKVSKPKRDTPARRPQPAVGPAEIPQPSRATLIPKISTAKRPVVKKATAATSTADLRKTDMVEEGVQTTAFTPVPSRRPSVVFPSQSIGADVQTRNGTALAGDLGSEAMPPPPLPHPKGGLDSSSNRIAKHQIDTAEIESLRKKVELQVELGQERVEKVLKELDSKVSGIDHRMESFLQTLKHQSTQNHDPGVGSPLDRYLPVFSVPLFSNKALPVVRRARLTTQGFDYDGVKDSLRSVTTLLPSARTSPVRKVVPVDAAQSGRKKDVGWSAAVPTSKPVAESPTKKQKTNGSTPANKPARSSSGSAPPVIPVKSTSLSILKSVLPLKDSLASRPPSPTKRPASPVKPSGGYVHPGSVGQELFLRRTSIRPASLAFFDHGIKGLRRDLTSVGGDLRVGSQDLRPERVVATPSEKVEIGVQVESVAKPDETETETVPVVADTAQPGPALPKPAASGSFETTGVQYASPARDVSLQYSTPDESSTSTSWAGVGITLSKAEKSRNSHVAQQDWAGVQSVFRHGADSTMEERLAQWIQSEVLLKLVSENRVETSREPAAATTETSPLPARASVRKMEAIVQTLVGHEPVSIATQTFGETAIQTDALEIPTQTMDAVADLALEEPLQVSSMDASASIAVSRSQHLAKADEEEMSLTTQPSSLESVSERMTRPPSVYQSSHAVQEPATQRPTLMDSDLASLVDRVISDAARADVIAIASSSIMQARQDDIEAKSTMLKTELLALQEKAQSQSQALDSVEAKRQQAQEKLAQEEVLIKELNNDRERYKLEVEKQARALETERLRAVEQLRQSQTLSHSVSTTGPADTHDSQHGELPKASDDADRPGSELVLERAVHQPDPASEPADPHEGDVSSSIP
ncbi:hypothetical protein HDU91_005270, partial [Kappamyces sp. JEL0680]